MYKISILDFVYKVISRDLIGPCDLKPFYLITCKRGCRLNN